MGKTFFISDTHFDHYNIIRYCDRPFKSVGEMNEKLILNWNTKVQPDDVVYHLGDFSMGDPNKFLPRLNGTINLILGNHDQKIRTRKCDVSRFNSIKDWDWHEDPTYGKILLCHYPLYDPRYVAKTKAPKDFDLSFHGHIHNHIPKNYPSGFKNLSVETNDYTPKTIDEIVDDNSL